ncbi:hypothetical protein BCR34DRAFT_390389 [Clohesyomyces aquaticus]|uniref:Uncharacterized protein n=1 Tax=Clohesyomyces aquaticus TaxID=1231657 RepID=A0A1Y1ZEJ6_9PLEO|nr:hypothetical protein BCR34DRAFT_390389 [Clohesyomyces aquaticus]
MSTHPLPLLQHALLLAQDIDQARPAVRARDKDGGLVPVLHAHRFSLALALASMAWRVGVLPSCRMNHIAFTNLHPPATRQTPPIPRASLELLEGELKSRAVKARERESKAARNRRVCGPNGGQRGALAGPRAAEGRTAKLKDSVDTRRTAAYIQQ